MSRPFQFDTRFPDDPTPDGPGMPPPPEPALGGFTEADLEAVRDRAFKQGLEIGSRDGFERGQQSARQSAEAQAAQALTGLKQAVRSALQSLAAVQDQTEREAVRVVTTLVTRLAPPLLEAVAAAELDTLVRDTLAAAVGRPCLRLRVHPGAVDRLNGLLPALAEQAGFAGAVDIAGDAALPPGAARADWGTGGALRDPRQIDRALADAVAIAISRLTTRVAHP